MYEIRFYRKNDDKHVKDNIAWHQYGFYEKFEIAMLEFALLFDEYKEMGLKEVVFNPSIPENKIEPYVLFMAKKGKEVVTIVCVEKIN